MYARFYQVARSPWPVNEEWRKCRAWHNLEARLASFCSTFRRREQAVQGVGLSCLSLHPGASQVLVELSGSENEMNIPT